MASNSLPSTYTDHLRAHRIPSWTSSRIEESEPRNPPPEYRHFHLSQSLQNLHSQRSLSRHRSRYIELDAEYAVDADESEEDDDLPGDLGLSMSTHILDGHLHSRSDTDIVDQDQEGHIQRSFYPIRGRRQPSTTSRISSDPDTEAVDIQVASPLPRSSVSSISKSNMETEPASPAFASNMKRSLQIDMKNLVGDSVANMSISPGSRDVVLAARRGMYIIDLEKPLEVPRFLPQGGTWDVADVQWNPHPARAEYIVSTSAERLLIWNLRLSGKSNIEHILQAHYRAVTDINWHTTECDTVVSTGVDSWLWAWDLRDPRKPIFGLSAFKSGGTQVKWSRQDGNILASSHANGVYIWDRRKGSLPVIRICAHNSKIYGIDWSHHQRNDIITCSLDRSIKVWDITESFTSGLYSGNNNRAGYTSASTFVSGNTYPDVSGLNNGENDYSIYGPVAQYAPKRTINTLYPVWRARYLPFGKGILSLAQRGDTSLEMYALNGPTDINVPSEVFEGHTDVVKEFVWRKGSDDEFQLITWSKDRTLKFWPIDGDVMQKVGYDPYLERSKQESTTSARVRAISFRNPPEGAGSRLAHHHQTHRSRSIFGSDVQTDGESELPLHTTTRPMNVPLQPGYSTKFKGKPMSRGPVGMAAMDAFAWLASVKVDDNRKECSSGAASGERSQSRYESSGSGRRSKEKLFSAAATSASSADGVVKVKRSESRSRTRESQQDTTGQALQDEITTVLTKLSSHKIKLEKHDLTKKRTCTLGLHGPWGENVRLQVFLRVTFTFPREYPYAKHPNGVPTIDVERNPLIPIRNRAFMLRRLRTIRERRRPCLEACLRFLLFGGEEEEQSGPALHLNSESSSEEDVADNTDLPPGERKKRKKEVPAISMLRDHKNLAEPRTSQGTFGPNGELVCFFRASPRVVRSVLRGLTNSSANAVPPDSISTPLSPPRQLEELPPTTQSFPEPEIPGMLRSPAVVSDAVWKLAEAAKDRGGRSPSGVRREGGGGAEGSIQRVLSNLLAFSQQTKTRRDSEAMSSTGHPAIPGSGVVGAGRSTFAAQDTERNYSLSVSNSAIFLVSTNDTVGPDRKAAVGYVYASEEGLGEVCERNAKNAKACGRYDHERAFKVLKTLFLETKEAKDEDKGKKQIVKPKFSSEVLAKQVFMQLYTDFSKDKDIQMLAMLSMLILQTYYCSPEAQTFSLAIFPPTFTPSPSPLSSMTPTQNRVLPRHFDGGSLFTSTSSILSLPKVGPVDYFSIARAINSTVIPPSSPDWPRLPTLSPPLHTNPGMPMTTSSSRGPWSSLFGATGVRQFMQDTFTKEGHPVPALDPVTAREIGRTRGEGRPTRPISAGESRRSLVENQQQQQQQQPPHKREKQKRHSVQVSQPQIQTHQASVLSGVAPFTRSSTEILPVPLKASLSFSSSSSGGSVGTRRSPLVPIEKNLDFGTRGQEKTRKKVVLFEDEEDASPLPLFDHNLVEQFKAHVNIYAEILHRWEMDHQRLELLKSISENVELKQETEGYGVRVTKTCPACLISTDKSTCATCGTHIGALLCSVCRLPIKGLSRTCLLCYHLTHISCLKSFNVPICPTGCGCMCEGWYGDPDSVGVVPGMVGLTSTSMSNSGLLGAPSTRASSVGQNDSIPPRSTGLHSLRNYDPPTLSLLLS